MASRDLAVLCDFDDTTAEQNVAELILEHFATDGWRALKKQFRAGQLSLRQYQEAAFRTTGATRQALQQVVVTKANTRPHFHDLYRYCQERDIPLAIVTHGLDFYVEALLRKEGLEGIPYYAVGTRFGPQGIQYTYSYTDGQCSGDWGNCKCAVLQLYRRQGYGIAYVGDGRSDFCPASTADLVFARSHLLEHCRKNGIPCVEFQDFGDVLRVLKDREVRA